MSDGAMHVSTPGDESLLIEVIGKHWRVGITLERDASEEGWYYVSDETLGNVMMSGGITLHQREMIADFVRGWEEGG